MNDDAKLLRHYAKTGAEEAFGTLVSRHLDLVFSAALRRTGGDRHLAQDIAQSVFTTLARKSATLSETAALGGWLYRHTCFVAAHTLRTESRRRVREAEAMRLNTPDATPEPAWEHLAPLLEEAMSQLGNRDREAVILRYFQKRDLRSVGLALGASEDAARMRVARALEKLREYFSRHGIRFTATALSALLAAHAVTAAPAGLAVQVTASAVASAAGGSGLALGLLKFFAMTKLKIAGTLLVTGLAASLIFQQQVLKELRNEELARLRAENERLTKLEVDLRELDQLRAQKLELLRLRGEVGVLRQRVKAQPASSTSPANVPRTEEAPPVTVYSAHANAQMNVSDTLAFGGWTTHPGLRTLIFVQQRIDEDGNLEIASKIVEAPEDLLAQLGAGVKTASNENPFQAILTAENSAAFLEKMNQNAGVEVLGVPKVITQDGRQVHIGIQDDLEANGVKLKTGPVIDIIPQLSGDHKSITLTVDSQIVALNTGPTRSEPAK